jgi:hypothetical protein
MRRVHDTKPALQGLSGTRRAYSDKPCGKRLDSHHHRTFTSHTRKGIDIILIRTAGRTRHRSPARLKLCTHPAKCRGHEDQPRTRSRGLVCGQGTRTGGAVDRYGRSPQIPPRNPPPESRSRGPLPPQGPPKAGPETGTKPRRRREGLTVTCGIDRSRYTCGIKISKAELATIKIERHSFHGEWNYTIKPNKKSN